MNYRKLNRGVAEDVAALVVGAQVANRFFDPSGPGNVDNMSLLEGIVVRIDGDPLAWERRTVWVRKARINGRSLPWYDQGEIDYFGGDLWLPVLSEEEAIDRGLVDDMYGGA